MSTGGVVPSVHSVKQVFKTKSALFTPKVWLMRCKRPHSSLFVNAASKGLAVDEKTGKIYFTSGRTVEVVNADGSGRNMIRHSDYYQIKRLAVDPRDG